MPPDHPPHRASVQKLFITGLLTLLPIWLTWVVIKFVFVLLSDISKPWVEPLSHRIAATFPQSLGWFNGLWVQNTIAMVATLFVILAVGALTRRVVGQRLLRWFEALIARVPLANVIYTSARKLLDMLETKPGSTQRVVLIDFPHRDMKSVGLVTRVKDNTAIHWTLLAVLHAMLLVLVFGGIENEQVKLAIFAVAHAKSLTLSAT